MLRPRRLPVLAAGLLVAALLGSCSTLRIDTRHSAAGQASRVQFLVLHYTAEDEPTSLSLLTTGRVSSHYLVGAGDAPVVYRLVPDDRLAHHAGLSEWQGHRLLNASSIGIEIVNAGWRDTPTGRAWAPYSEGQVAAVVTLVEDLVRRHGIRPDRVLGHSDIAPTRKQDPGPLFPWHRLAERGLVAWPDAQAVATARVAFDTALPDWTWFRQRLSAVGYAVPADDADPQMQQVLQAFQMKYRPSRHDGERDAETAALLQVLSEAP